MEFTFDKFNEVKHEAESFYEKIVKVYCPFFSQDIYFNSKGWDHLIFKKWNKTRPIDDQFSRLRHLKLAPAVITNSKTLQGVKKINRLERIKRTKGGWDTVMKWVSYYEFISVMESHNSQIRVKVIVKQVDDGEKYFLSIIPYWGVNNKGERVMYSGDPEND